MHLQFDFSINSSNGSLISSRTVFDVWKWIKQCYPCTYNPKIPPVQFHFGKIEKFSNAAIFGQLTQKKWYFRSIFWLLFICTAKDWNAEKRRISAFACSLSIQFCGMKTDVLEIKQWHTNADSQTRRKSISHKAFSTFRKLIKQYEFILYCVYALNIWYVSCDEGRIIWCLVNVSHLQLNMPWISTAKKKRIKQSNRILYYGIVDKKFLISSTKHGKQLNCVFISLIDFWQTRKYPMLSFIFFWLRTS